jgi:hypothetical protein
MLALSRLFPREIETSYRSTSGYDLDAAHTNNSGHVAVDPWRAVFRVAGEGQDGLLRSLQWLCVLARSGVEIPVAVFMRFSALTTEYNASMTDSFLFVRSVMSVTWLKYAGRPELQVLFSELHARLAPQIVQCFESGIAVEEG